MIFIFMSKYECQFLGIYADNENSAILKFKENGEIIKFHIDKNKNIYTKLNEIKKNEYYILDYEFSEDKKIKWLNNFSLKKYEEKIDNNLKYNELENFILKNNETLKIFLSFLIKNFSFEYELEVEYNIEKSAVKKVLKYFVENDLIICRHFSNLDLNEQEIIKTLNSAYKKRLDKNPNIYVKTNLINKINNSIKNEIENKIKNSQGLNASYQFLLNKKNSYDLLKKKYDRIEKTKFKMERFSEDGILFFTETKREKFFKKNLNEVKYLFNPKYEIVKSKQTKKFIEPILEKKIIKNIGEVGISSKKIDKFQIDKSKIIIDEILNHKKINTKLFNKIISQIKTKKKLSYLMVEKLCQDENNFKKFLEYMSGKNIFIDEEIENFIFIEN